MNTKNRILLIFVSFSWILLIHLTLALSTNSVQTCNVSDICSIGLGESLAANGLTIIYMIAIIVFATLTVIEIIDQIKRRKV